MAWEIEPGWVLGAFSVLFATLTGVVGTVGKKLIERLDDCETKHQQAYDEYSKVARELAEVKGELKGIKLFAAPELAKNVAKAVVEAIRNENT